MSHAERLSAIQRSLYYGGAWHKPHDARHETTFDPGRGASLGTSPSRDSMMSMPR